MIEDSRPGLQQRVIQAAESELKRVGSVGPLELFRQLLFLQPVHFEAWRKGHESYSALEAWIQVGPEKFQKCIEYFHAWVKERGLRPIEASYTRRGPHGVEQLKVTADGDPAREKFYRIHYASAELTGPKKSRLAEKLNKAPDLVVFEKVSEDGNCHECDREFFKGSMLVMEKGEPLCLDCADLDELVFLPAGNTAMSRRARKHSSLSAVVVRFSRSRKRYERQGLLVTPEGLAKAEAECAADDSERAVARQRAAVARGREDEEFTRAFTQAIVRQYPGCPPEQAQRIAAHAGSRGSGRVGRSAAGRELDARAIELAVVAHIRHRHTRYDELLMQGIERLTAREAVRADIDRVIANWSGEAGDLER
jgi:hypothetical protein